MIRILFTIQPDALNVSERTFSYSDVIEFQTIDAFREHVIEKQIESVLRDSHADQFRWLESRFKVELRKGLASWPAFIEITERRNLFVHNNGLVTKQYIDVCAEYKIDCGPKLTSGSGINRVVTRFSMSRIGARLDTSVGT